MNASGRTTRAGIIVVAIFAIISGFNEVVVGFTGNFLGILSRDLKPSTGTVIVGGFYVLGGLSLLPDPQESRERSHRHQPSKTF